jgi:uncharacterized membrane protein YdjX (TVP38/TMEM64 family)
MWKTKKDLLQIISWIFAGIVIIQSLISGIKYGCWGGFIVLLVGAVLGTAYYYYKISQFKQI